MDGLGSEVQAALDEWFRCEVDRVWRQYQSGSHARALVPRGASSDEERAIQRKVLDGDADTQLARLTDEYRVGDYNAGKAGAHAIAASLAEPFDEGDQRFAMLMKRVTEALGEVEEARLQWAMGRVEHRPSPPSSTVQKPTVTHDDADVPALGQLARAYLAHRQAERNTSGKMMGQLQGQLDILLTDLGAETRVTEVTPAVAGQVFTAFRSLPRGFRKVDALKDMSLSQAAETARKLGLAPMNAKTINNHMTTMRGLFREAMQQGVITANPFQGKHLNVEKCVGSDRDWTLEEAERIFSSTVFVGCERDGRPFQPGSSLLNDWRFWLPLVALMTGARISELCQLRHTDVQQVNRIWTLNINADDGKRLKTKQSKRIIPCTTN